MKVRNTYTGMLLLGLITLLYICISTSAADVENETQYQVNIEIQYNSVDADTAQKIISAALKEHSTACTVDAKAKKITDVWYTIDSVSTTNDSTVSIALE